MYEHSFYTDEAGETWLIITRNGKEEGRTLLGICTRRLRSKLAARVLDRLALLQS